MWWLVIPGAAAVAYKVYDALRERNEDGTGPGRASTSSDAGTRDDLPPFGPRFERWVAILRPDDQAIDAAADTPPGAAAQPEPSSGFRFRPSHLTLLTAVALVAATVLQPRIDAVWLSWTRQVLLGALIGIGTNWIAIKMLFRPRKKFLGVIQGVVPANQHRIAEQIANGVASHLLDRETIRRAVHDSDLVGTGLDEMVAGIQRLVSHETFRHDVEELCVSYVGAFFEDEAFRKRFLDAIARAARNAPEHMGGVLGVFSGEVGKWLESMVHEHQDAILGGLQEQVPEIVDEAAERIIAWLQTVPEGIEGRRSAIEQMMTEGLARRAASFDVAGLVRRRLEAYSIDDLERLILSATDEQLAWLQYLGWIIGAAAVPLLAGLEALVRAL